MGIMHAVLSYAVLMLPGLWCRSFCLLLFSLQCWLLTCNKQILDQRAT
jgi:hypothetical protein